MDTAAGSKTLTYQGDSASTVAGVATGNGGTGSTVITFAATTNILIGMTISAGAGAVVSPANARVVSKTATSVTFDKAVSIDGTSATTAVNFSQAFTMNLSTDVLDVTGGSNISTVATAVASNLGVITIDLNDRCNYLGYKQSRYIYNYSWYCNMDNNSSYWIYLYYFRYICWRFNS